jgi:hypothetical protein
MTLSDLDTECQTCSRRAVFTGRTVQREARTFWYARCAYCKEDFAVWRKDREALVAAYVTARAQLADRAGYERAWTVLRGGDGEAIAALLADPPAEMPLFSVDDVAVPATSAARWCELVLFWQGWRPEPGLADRIEEALVAAVRLASAKAAEAVLDAVRSLPAAATRGALAVIDRRMYGEDTHLIDPVRAALRERVD